MEPTVPAPQTPGCTLPQVVVDVTNPSRADVERLLAAAASLAKPKASDGDAASLPGKALKSRHFGLKKDDSSTDISIEMSSDDGAAAAASARGRCGLLRLFKAAGAHARKKFRGLCVRTHAYTDTCSRRGAAWAALLQPYRTRLGCGSLSRCVLVRVPPFYPLPRPAAPLPRQTSSPLNGTTATHTLPNADAGGDREVLHAPSKESAAEALSQLLHAVQAHGGGAATPAKVVKALNNLSAYSLLHFDPLVDTLRTSAASDCPEAARYAYAGVCGRARVLAYVCFVCALGVGGAGRRCACGVHTEGKSGLGYIATYLSLPTCPHLRMHITPTPKAPACHAGQWARHALSPFPPSPPPPLPMVWAHGPRTSRSLVGQVLRSMGIDCRAVGSLAYARRMEGWHRSTFKTWQARRRSRAWRGRAPRGACSEPSLCLLCPLPPTPLPRAPCSCHVVTCDEPPCHTPPPTPPPPHVAHMRVRASAHAHYASVVRLAVRLLLHQVRACACKARGGGSSTGLAAWNNK